MECAAIAIVAAYALASGLTLVGNTVNIFDESLQLQGGRLVLEGLVPNRDFSSLYPPLNYYLNALAFSAFGTSAVSARLLTLGIHAATCVMIVRYLDLRLRYDRPVVKSFAILLSVYMLTQVLPLSAANPLLLSVLFLTYYLAAIARGVASTQNSLLVTGICAGLLLTMRINLGVYALAGISLDLLLSTLRRGRGIREGLTEAWRALRWFGTPPLLIFGAYLLYSGPSHVSSQTIGALPQILQAGMMLDPTANQQTFWAIAGLIGLGLWLASQDSPSRWSQLALRAGVFATTLYTSGRLLEWLLDYDLLLIPFVIPFLLVSTALFGQWRWQWYPRSVFIGLAFLFASFQYYLIRADLWHLWALGAGLCLVVISAAASRPTIHQLAGLAACCFVTIMPFSAPWIVTQQWTHPIDLQSMDAARSLLLDHRSMFYVGDSARLLDETRPLSPAERRLYPNEGEQAALRFIQKVTGPEEPVFVGLQKHVHSTVNNARFNWVLERPPGTRYLQLESGIITREPAQREIIASLEEGVDWIARARMPPLSVPWVPYEASQLLDQYIERSFRCVYYTLPVSLCCRPEACSDFEGAL